MTHLLHLLIFSLILITITSSQTDKTLSNQNSRTNSMDINYLDACTAILKGLNFVNTGPTDLWYSFAEWENTNLVSTFIGGYFENNKGIISKIYIDNYYDDTWTFDLVLHDGYFVDTKHAEIQIYIENVQNDTTLNQPNGTFTTINSSMSFTVSYGENFDIKSQIDITGQVSIYFLNKDTNQPFTNFGRNDDSVKDYSIQLSFTSSDGSFSFSTSIFTSSYMTGSNNAVAAIFALVSIIVSVISWCLEDLWDKVTVGNLQAFYASASYIAIWVFIQKGYYGFFFFVLLIPAGLNWWKLFYWVLRKGFSASDGACIGLLLTTVAAALNFIPTVWINLFPSFVLLLPFIQKLWNIKHNPQYLSRFEISNFLYVLLWATYAYNYSGNFYRIAPKKTLFLLTFGCIMFQFVVLLLLELRGSKIAEQPLLLDAESQKNQETTSGNDKQTKEHVKTTSHRYTLDVKSDEYNQLLLQEKECDICKTEMAGFAPKSLQSLYKTPCGHVFHKVCLREYGLTERMSCPSCETQLPEFKGSLLKNK